MGGRCGRSSCPRRREVESLGEGYVVGSWRCGRGAQDQCETEWAACSPAVRLRAYLEGEAQPTALRTREGLSIGQLRNHPSVPVRIHQLQEREKGGEVGEWGTAGTKRRGVRSTQTRYASIRSYRQMRADQSPLPVATSPPTLETATEMTGRAFVSR